MSVREVGVGVRRRGPGWGERPSTRSGDVGGSVVLAVTHASAAPPFPVGHFCCPGEGYQGPGR